MTCALHPNEPASPDCEGWSVQLCDRCLHSLGYPSQEPQFGATYGIAAEILRADELARNTRVATVVRLPDPVIHPSEAHG